MRCHLQALMVGTCTCLVLAGCAASPRQRPLPTTPIAEGPDTIQAARKELQGRWTLVSLDVATEDGRLAEVESAGELVADDFGNLHVEFRMSDAGQKTLTALGIHTPNPVISTSGQVVIDTQNKKITYVSSNAEAQAFDPNLAALRANPFALQRPRYYVIDDTGILTLSTRYDSGKDAATSRWKKAS